MLSIIVNAQDDYNNGIRIRHPVHDEKDKYEHIMNKTISHCNMKEHVDNLITAATNFRYILTTDNVLSVVYPMKSHIIIPNPDKDSHFISNLFKYITYDFLYLYGNDQVWIDILCEIMNDINANKDEIKMPHDDNGLFYNDITTVSGHIGSYELSYRIHKTKSKNFCRNHTSYSWYGRLKIYIIPHISKHNFKYINFYTSQNI